MDHDQVFVRELDPRIERRDPRIVPLGDLAEEDVGDGRGIELERRGAQARQVVCEHDGAENGRQVRDVTLDRRDLLIRHRSVGRTEVDRTLRKLPDAAARSDRLVVDLDAGLLGIRLKPAGVDGVRKGGARAVQIGLTLGRSRCAKRDSQAEQRCRAIDPHRVLLARGQSNRTSTNQRSVTIRSQTRQQRVSGWGIATG